MSIIPADDRATVIRFMFLSLMSLGATTATALLIATAVTVNWGPWNWWQVLGCVTAGFSVLFIVRRFDFYNRFQRLSFDMAAAVLREE